MLSEVELKKEREYLKNTFKEISNRLNFLQSTLDSYNERTHELSKFIADNFYDMDAQEAAVQRNLLDNLNLEKAGVERALFKCEKQAERPYFGRIDFVEDFEENPESYYIGISFLDNPNGFPYVLDWRAPVSSLYYDYELGKASYTAPDGEISGEITLKRQYKVEGDNLLFAFDSSVTINDEILQDALGENSGSKMKQIVSTIQKEQNLIIRSADYQNLVVQGIAGSGKTSIALHRVAYLLYKNRLASKDIVIISPSPLFSDYISEVLPELGEQNVFTTTFEEIAKEELEGILNFESRADMLEDLLSGNIDRAKEVNYKEGEEFFQSLKTFLNEVVSLSFEAKDINLGDKKIKAETINNLYNERYKTKKPAIRIEWIADYIIDQLGDNINARALTSRVKKVLLSMFKINNITEIYLAFLSAIGMSTNIYSGKNFLHFEDVAPVLYIKDYILGTAEFKEFKFAVIDEMQDYSLIALELIAKRYPCPKTVLGDIYQSIERVLNHSYLNALCTLLNDAKLVKLAKTYRSTVEITEYCQKLIGLEGAINFHRHGEPVKTFTGENLSKTLIDECEECKTLGYKHIAIITPTMKEAEKLYFENPDLESALITDSTSELPEGVIIIPATLCKGLEFDAVISVRKEPKSYLEKNAEYITATRALHKLCVISI